MTKKIMAIQAKKKELVAKGRAILDGDDRTPEALARYDAIEKEIDGLDAELAMENRQIERERNMGAVPTGDAAQGGPGKTGFGSLGEQLAAVIRADRTGGRVLDQRLVAGPTGLGESVSDAGGFAIERQFNDELLRRTYEVGQVLSRVRRIPIGPMSNGVKLIAIDESSRADGSRYGGVQAYWAGEGDSIAASKPKFRRVNMELRKLVAAVYLTEEILEDWVALESLVRAMLPEELSFVVENAIFNGTGVGQPLGFMNSGALVTQAVRSGQTAATPIVTGNVTDMFSRLWSPNRGNAIFAINQDLEPSIMELTLGQQPLYVAPGSFPQTPPSGSLFGRPLIPVEYTAAKNAVGDIVLFDPSQYVMIDKGGIKTNVSMHVRFLHDEQVLKFTYRVDGAPWWNTTLTPRNSSDARSPFVTLAVRS